MKAAVEDASTKVIAERGKVEVRAIPVQGLVAGVSGKQIILNVGGKAGVKVGDRLSIQRSGQEFKDPATGKVIRRITTEVGVVRIVDVDDESSIGEIESGAGFKNRRSGPVREVAIPRHAAMAESVLAALAFRARTAPQRRSTNSTDSSHFSPHARVESRLRTTLSSSSRILAQAWR